MYFFLPDILLKTFISFRGVVTVDVPLDLLEINPCPQPFSVQNAFKNTARCPTESTTVRSPAPPPYQTKLNIINFEPNFF